MHHVELITEAINSLSLASPRDVGDFLVERIGDKQAVVYGAGAFGNEVFGYLQKNGARPICFLDAFKTGHKLGLEIIHPDRYPDKSAIVVLAIVLDKARRNKIVTTLNELGYENILDGQKIRAHYVGIDGAHTAEHLNARIEEILRPLSFLADEESRETYTRNVVSHLTRRYDDSAETDACEQYYMSPLLHESGSIFYVDCGAYNGDTFRRLLQRKVNLSHYFGFEPIPDNFAHLAKAVSESAVKATLFPLAVSNKHGFGRFQNLLGSSGAAQDGDTEVQYGRIDDVIQNSSVNFLKMDIEGDEPSALEGARNLIERCVPELAISVYHKINHFWEIPNRLHDLDLGYHLYMRTHSSACMETVLYANKRPLV